MTLAGNVRPADRRDCVQCWEILVAGSKTYSRPYRQLCRQVWGFEGIDGDRDLRWISNLLISLSEWWVLIPPFGGSNPSTPVKFSLYAPVRCRFSEPLDPAALRFSKPFPPMG